MELIGLDFLKITNEIVFVNNNLIFISLIKMNEMLVTHMITLSICTIISLIQ